MLTTSFPLLLYYRAKIIPTSCLIVAAHMGHYEIATILVKGCADLAATTSTKTTALHLAAAAGHYKICELLVASGAAVNSFDVNGCSPWYLAVTNKHEEIIKLLLPRCSNPLVKALYDYTADDEGEINLKEGDILSVVEIMDGGWWKGTVLGSDSPPGVFPSNFVIPHK